MERFVKYQRKRHFGRAPDITSREGFVYVPLQGRLLSNRSFQYCSPIEMIEHLLANDTSWKFLVTLHPKEKYNAEETEAIFALEEKHKRLTVCNHNTSS